VKIKQLLERHNAFTREDAVLIRKAAKGIERKDLKYSDILFQNDDIMETIIDYYIEEMEEYYLDDMPYGIQKGKTGTPDEWLYDNFENIENWIMNNLKKIAREVSMLELS